MIQSFDRSQTATGIDLVLEPLGDLQLTATGDLQLTQGADLIIKSFMRRLHTPVAGYRRWVRTATGLRELDSEYGNPAYGALSQPLSAETEQQIRAGVEACARAEGRIEVVSVTLTPLPVYRGRVELTLVYRILSEEQLRTTTYALRDANG